MRKLTLSLLAGAAAIAAGGAAYAQAGAPAGGELTRAAVEQRTAQAFQRIDTNGDGKIDQADREARHKARFDRIDADSNGAISYAEFTAKRGDRAEGRERMGRRGGRDGHRMGMRGLRGHGGFVRGMADADKDGAITQAEFQTAALQRFDRVDADNNGTVTREERKAVRDAMRQQRRARHDSQAS